MLGPSGSGKTTMLRMIAGFETPDRGTVELAGSDVTDLAPYDREVNTVFQDYALFPHMSVGDNVEYGLRGREGRARGARAPPLRGARDGAPLRLRRAPALGALRRAAPARRAGAGDRQPAAGAAARRAARRTRPEAPRAAPDRAQADPARGRHHLRLRHPRPGGGADDVGPHRRLQRGPDRAGRRPRGRLRAARQHLRRRLRRDLERGRAPGRQLHGAAGEGAAARRGRERRRMRGRGRHDPDVSYAGMVTRLHVDLDEGGRIQVARQNAETTSHADDESLRGRRVKVGMATRAHGRGRRAGSDQKRGRGEDG